MAVDPQDAALIPDEKRREEMTRKERYRADRIGHARKRSLVLSLAASGMSAKAIAEQLMANGIQASQGGVSRIIALAMKEARARDEASVENIRSLQLERIDAALQSIWAKVKSGDLAAHDRFIKLEALRAKLAGTEAPQQVEHSGTVEHRLSPEEVERRQQAWIASGGDVVDAEVVADDSPALPAANGSGP